MAAVLSGLNTFARSFRSSICLQRYLRPTNFDVYRYFAGRKSEEKPKKPLSPFFIYMNSVRSQLARQNPNLRLVEISKLAAAQYKELSDEKKQELRQNYEERKAAYEKEMRDFLAGCSESEIKEMKDEAKSKRRQRRKRRERKEEKELSKPKKPMTGFLQFVHECRERDLKENPEKFKTMKVTAYTEEVSAEWRRMSPAEKEVYEKMYRKAKAEYEKKLLAWEALMIKENKLHLVRASHLPKPKPKKRRRRSAKSGTKTAAKKNDIAPKGDPRDHEISDAEE